MLKELLIAFGIMAICVVIHTTGMLMFAEWLLSSALVTEKRPALTRYLLLLITVFAVITILHVAETGVWALFYYTQGLFEDFETALYFSLGSYTTIGYGDVVLPEKWRLLGGIEGVSGVLLCGLSTAFIFAIVNGLFQIRLQASRKANIS
jgi:hypothetical protein